MKPAVFEVRTSSTLGTTAVIENGTYIRQEWPDQSDESLSAAFAYCHELTELERRFCANPANPIDLFRQSVNV